MDANFSHDPVHVKEFRKAVVQADLVLGSRYLNGKVTVVNWPMGRLLLSYCANIYARWITGLRIWDLTGGFKCFRRRVRSEEGRVGKECRCRGGSDPRKSHVGS